jgi:hypothetical protein
VNDGEIVAKLRYLCDQDPDGVANKLLSPGYHFDVLRKLGLEAADRIESLSLELDKAKSFGRLYP